MALGCFLIEKHIEIARMQRGVTRRDQIAALVLPAVMMRLDRELGPEHPGNPDHPGQAAYEDLAWQRAYGMADAGDRHRGNG